MRSYEVITIIVSSGALIASIIAILMSKGANNVALGNIELYINEIITHTKEKVSDCVVQMTELVTKENRTAQENKMLITYEKAFYSAIENNLNAYEEACAKYLDKKVDKGRFAKLYKSEIKQVVENNDLKQKYFDGVTSKYKAILKVYKEWEDLEK